MQLYFPIAGNSINILLMPGLGGDLVIGRLQGVPQTVCVERLGMVGGIIGFNRQLDISLRDDLLVDRAVDAFLQGRYQVTLDIFVKEKSNAVEH